MGPRVFAEILQYGEEPELVPAWAISLAGCNLRCTFCITARESQDKAAGEPADVRALATRAARAVEEGARSVVVLGGEPTLYPELLIDLSRALEGLGVPRVLKTNLVAGRRTLERVLPGFEVVVADYKFGNDECALRLAGCRGYTRVLRRNLARVAASGKRLIVRHLAMPGHEACCTAPVREWTARELPGARLSVRDQFVPAFRMPAASSRETLRFHVDRRGRILVENFTRELLELAQALAPGDPAIGAWLEDEGNRNVA